MQTGQPALAPCTAAGIIEILKRSHLPIAGQNAVVVGRSDIVGKPTAIMLLAENATVTVCHSKTRDLASFTQRADILVVAIGKPALVTENMVKPGATILDAGINRVTDRAEFERYFAGDARREEIVPAEGFHHRWRCASQGIRIGRRLYAGAWRRWAADHCHVDGEHRAGRQASPRFARLGRETMLRVGLTGGLGSGKSTVAGIFGELGAAVISADQLGRQLMQPGEPVYAAIVQTFGRVWSARDGSLDRKALAELAFEHNQADALNHIVHPAVIAAEEEWMRGVFAADPKRVAIVESALIFEVEKWGTAPGWVQRFDKLILVTVPDEVKIARFVSRLMAKATAKRTGRAG